MIAIMEMEISVMAIFMSTRNSSKLLSEVVAEIESDKEKFIGQDIEAFFNRMRYELIDKEIGEFSKKWCLPFEDVKYEVYNFKDGNLANENSLKSKIDYDRYKEMVENLCLSLHLGEKWLRILKIILWERFPLYYNYN